MIRVPPIGHEFQTFKRSAREVGRGDDAKLAGDLPHEFGGFPEQLVLRLAGIQRLPDRLLLGRRNGIHPDQAVQVKPVSDVCRPPSRRMYEDG